MMHLSLAVYRGRAVGAPPIARYSRHEQMESTSPKQPESFHRRMVEERVRDPEFRTEYERLRAEMLEQLAPASEGPVVNPGRKRTGRLVFGDATE